MRNMLPVYEYFIYQRETATDFSGGATDRSINRFGSFDLLG
jgi:hypothetical protein